MTSEKQPSRRTVASILCLLLLLPIFLVYLGWDGYRARREIDSWPSTSGIVFDSRMEESYKVKGRYRVVIRYQYLVGDRYYNGDHVGGLNLRFYAPDEAQQVLERFPKESRVEVYYSPDDPSNSVLERAALPPDSGDFMILPALFALLLIYSIYHVLRYGVDSLNDAFPKDMGRRSHP